MAGAALVVIATVMLHGPRQLIVPSPSTPPQFVIAKSQPPPAVGRPDRNIVRKLAPTGLLPTLVSPKQDSVVTREQLEFTWESVPRSRYYEVQVVTSEGDPVWEGQTERAVLKFHGDLVLKDGPYFVWILAYSDDGRVQKSAPVRFLVTASR